MLFQKKMSLKEFKKIYQAHHVNVRKTLFWIVGEDLLDDAVQEAFFKVWQKSHLFRGESSHGTWIHRVAVNTGLSLLRKNKRHKADRLENFETIEKSENSVDDPQLQKVIVNSILQLPEKQRVVFVLHYKQELSVEEIAKTLNIAQGTVKSRLHHGREGFKGNLKKNGVEYE